MDKEVESLKKEVDELKAQIERRMKVTMEEQLRRFAPRTTLPGMSLKVILFALSVILVLVAAAAPLVIWSYWTAGPWSGIPLGVNLGLPPDLMEPLGDVLEPLGGTVQALTPLVQDLKPALGFLVPLGGILTAFLGWLSNIIQQVLIL
jgi:hypothetical protein